MKQFAVATSQIQVRIKKIILDGLLLGQSRVLIFDKVGRAIKQYLASIPPSERETYAMALEKGALAIYQKTKRDLETKVAVLGLSIAVVYGILKGQSNKATRRQIAKEKGKEWLFEERIDIPQLRQKVKAKFNTLLNELSDQEIKTRGGASLRNASEMLVRHEAQQASIAEYREKGIRLVWASTHSDCSKRCAPWQGRLYSLDGTSGEIDGHKFVPLETATDVWYITKSGKRWKNGLLGFNCRHRLIPYRGQERPKGYSKQVMEQQRALDVEQRRQERAIRKIKTEGFLLRGTDNAEARKKFATARKLYSEYREFCERNNRVAQVFRTQVTVEEIRELRS